MHPYFAMNQETRVKSCQDAHAHRVRYLTMEPAHAPWKSWMHAQSRKSGDGRASKGFASPYVVF